MVFTVELEIEEKFGYYCICKKQLKRLLAFKGAKCGNYQNRIHSMCISKICSHWKRRYKKTTKYDK